MTVRAGSDVRVSFDRPVSAVAYGKQPAPWPATCCSGAQSSISLGTQPATGTAGGRRRAASLGEGRRSHAGELVPAVAAPR